MTWVTWRLQRTETLIAAGILALLAAFLVPTGIEMAHAYTRDGIPACLTIRNGNCGGAIGAFRQDYQSLIDTSTWFLLVPGLIGVVLAAPFIQDLDNGTYRLAWTQSVTRGRWLLAKLALPVVAAVVAAGLLTLLFTWWRAPSIHIDGRLETGNYDMTGTVAIAYTLFALALALAIGAASRRVAPSLIVAFAGYVAARVFVDSSLRDHLVAPLKATYKGAEQPSFLYNAHVVSMRIVLPGGKAFGSGGFSISGQNKFAAPDLRNAVFHVVYHPASHYWPLQLTETGLFVGISAILILFAALWTRQRAA